MRKDGERSIPCNKTATIDLTAIDSKEFTVYLEKSEICDRTMHCPDGEDEEFERCQNQNTFPPEATFQCESPWNQNNNTNVTILAAKCNGIKECKNGEDEKGCEIDDRILYAVLGGCLLVFLVISSYIVLFQSSKVRKLVTTLMDIASATDSNLETTITNSSQSQEREDASWALFNRKLAEHGRSLSKALNDIHVSCKGENTL